MKNKYTIDDCMALRNALREDPVDPVEFVDFYDQVIRKAKEIVLNRELKDDDIEKLIRAWLTKNHLEEANTIYKFLFEVELKKVALYINNERLKIYVKWRLKIAK